MFMLSTLRSFAYDISQNAEKLDCFGFEVHRLSYDFTPCHFTAAGHFYAGQLTAGNFSTWTFDPLYISPLGQLATGHCSTWKDCC